jgi:hypothetical protein
MRSQGFVTIIGNPKETPRLMTEFVAEGADNPFSPAQSVVLALRVRIIPTIIKNTFLLKKSILLSAVSVPRAWAVPSCGGIADPERLMDRRRGA